MMEMMSERREESLLMDPELLTPTYQALLELHIQIGRPWKVSQSDANRYEVHSPRLAFTPNLYHLNVIYFLFLFFKYHVSVRTYKYVLCILGVLKNNT